MVNSIYVFSICNTLKCYHNNSIGSDFQASRNTRKRICVFANAINIWTYITDKHIIQWVVFSIVSNMLWWISNRNTDTFVRYCHEEVCCTMLICEHMLHDTALKKRDVRYCIVWMKRTIMLCWKCDGCFLLYI